MFESPFGSVRRASSEVEPQEVFLDTMAARQREREGRGVDQAMEVPLSAIVLRLLFVGFAVLLAVFLSKTFELQVVKGEEQQRLAQNNTLRVTPIPAERGVIYDRAGRQLVFNRPSFDLVCDKRDMPHDPQLLQEVIGRAALLSGTSFEELKDSFDASSSPLFLVAENLDHEELVVAETRIGELTGCSVAASSIREYEKGGALSHVLGYTAKISSEELSERPEYEITDQIGKVGVERAYEEVLRGRPGRETEERDALGRVVGESGFEEPEPGSSLSLYLDLELQKTAARALAESLGRVGAERGVVIAMDPKTGGVLAMVSLPAFDNNAFAGGITAEEYARLVSDSSKPLFNRAVSGVYPTGSTIKPFVAAAALEEDVIDPDRSILTQGYIEVPNQYDPEIVYRFNDNANHGWVDMRRAIAVSSNVYFYTIGGGYGNQEGLGPTRIAEYLNRFGWGRETGVDIPGEQKGLVPTPDWKRENKGEGWWDGDTYLLSIGQGNLLATPLQLARAFSAIANGGTVLEPRLVAEVRGEGRVSSSAAATGVADEETLRVVKEGMRQAVTSGSSTLLSSLGVEVAAKTGTAQTPVFSTLHNWISVFAPYEDPQIVVTVLVENVPGEQVAALPVAKEVLEWYFAQY